MSIQTVPHLNFQGQARAALHFYHAVFGGRIAMVTYQDAGNVRTASDANLITWGQVESDEGFRVMAYDVAAGTSYDQGSNAFFVSVRGNSADEIRSLWDKLVEGADIVQALAPAQWSALYGMLKDRFGVVWVLDVAVSQ